MVDPNAITDPRFRSRLKEFFDDVLQPALHEAVEPELLPLEPGNARDLPRLLNAISAQKSRILESRGYTGIALENAEIEVGNLCKDLSFARNYTHHKVGKEDIAPVSLAQATRWYAASYRLSEVLKLAVVDEIARRFDDFKQIAGERSADDRLRYAYTSIQQTFDQERENYLKTIGALEADKQALERQVQSLEQEADDLKRAIGISTDKTDRTNQLLAERRDQAWHAASLALQLARAYADEHRRAATLAAENATLTEAKRQLSEENGQLRTQLKGKKDEYDEKASAHANLVRENVALAAQSEQAHSVAQERTREKNSWMMGAVAGGSIAVVLLTILLLLILRTPTPPSDGPTPTAGVTQTPPEAAENSDDAEAPAPSSTAQITSTNTLEPTRSPTIEPTSTAKPTSVPTSTATDTPTAFPTPTAPRTPTPTRRATATVTPTPTAILTPTPVPLAYATIALNYDQMDRDAWLEYREDLINKSVEWSGTVRRVSRDGTVYLDVGQEGWGRVILREPPSSPFPELGEGDVITFTAQIENIWRGWLINGGYGLQVELSRGTVDGHVRSPEDN